MVAATRYSAAAEIRRQSDLAKDIAKLQASVSSGIRLTAPSDDPSATGRVSEIRQTQADQTVYSRNVTTGTAISDAVDTRLTSVATLLDRAKDLMLAGRNDTASPEDRAVIAAELRGIAGDISHYSQETDPTGRALFPADEPLSIPVSDTLSLTATATRADIFDNVTLADGTKKSIGSILADAANALEETDPTIRDANIDIGIDEIELGVGHMSAARAAQGVRGGRFDDAKEALSVGGDRLKIERAALEGTDLTATVTDFQAKSLSLQAAQMLFAKTSQSTLFDLLG